MSRGTLVISLDFELFWGMTDVTTLDRYGANIRGVHAAIPKILELFKRYDVHATWGVVGMLTYYTRLELEAALPKRQPAYADMQYSNYAYLARTALESEDVHHFGPKLVTYIQETPHQEIGSHTFSHYYCTEAGQGLEDFEADIEAEEQALQRFGVRPTSIIFPRNQWREEYLPVLTKHGITVFRGNPRGWVYESRPRGTEHLFLRLLRLLDAYLPLFGAHTHDVRPGTPGDVPHNVPASFFFRPYSPSLSFLEPLRLLRIKRSMTRAAKRGELVHLWWHPHNFGVHTEKNLALLEDVLQHYVFLKKQYGMETCTMSEASLRT